MVTYEEAGGGNRILWKYRFILHNSYCCKFLCLTIPLTSKWWMTYCKLQISHSIIQHLIWSYFGWISEKNKLYMITMVVYMIGHDIFFCLSFLLTKKTMGELVVSMDHSHITSISQMGWTFTSTQCYTSIKSMQRRTTPATDLIWSFSSDNLNHNLTGQWTRPQCPCTKYNYQEVLVAVYKTVNALIKIKFEICHAL